MKNWFSVKLYLEGLKKIKTAGIASAITVSVLNALIPLFLIIEKTMSDLSWNEAITAVPTFAFTPFCILLLFFAPILAHSMYSYLNERNMSDFWHAIPQKRTCVYFSFLASIWTWLLGTILASSLLNLLLYVMAGARVSASVFFVSAAVYFLGAIMVAAFMTLAMTMTGTNVSNLLIAALLLFIVRILGAIFSMGLDELTPMIDISRSFWRFLEMDFFLPFAIIGSPFSEDAGVFSDLPLLLYSVGATILLVALGAVAYNKRKSESANRSAPSRLLQHIYRCAVTLPIAFLMGVLLISNSFDTFGFFLLFVVNLLIWILFELMTTKKFRNAIRSLPLFIVPFAVSFVLCCSIFLARNAIWSVTPEAEKIEGISLDSYSNYSTPSYEQLGLRSAKLENAEINQLISDSLKNTVRMEKEDDSDPNLSRRHLLIHLKSGRIIGRYLEMSDKQYERIHEALLASEEHRNALLSLPSAKQIDSVSVWGVGYDKEVSKRVWASFVYEYNLLTDEQKYAIKNYYNSGDYYPYEFAKKEDLVGNGCLPAGRISVVGMVGMETFDSTYPIYYEYMPQTAQLYLELYSEANATLAMGTEKKLERIWSMIEDSEEAAQAFHWVNINFELLLGDEALGNFHFTYSNQEPGEWQKVKALFEVLNDLSEPENYEYREGKTVIQIALSVDAEGAFMQEFSNLIDFKYGKEMVYSTYLEFPVALNREETARLAQAVELMQGQ